VAPALSSYGQNLITVDVKNMPLDYSISSVNQRISPPVWSGSCISFDAIKVRAVTGAVYAKKENKKTPLEYLDISMKAGGSVVTSPTGKGGEFYLENTLPQGPQAGAEDKQSCRAIAERGKRGANLITPGVYHAEMDFDGKKCGFEIVFPDTDDVITDLGEIQCVLP